MNIDRVAPRASEIGLRRTELPSQPFDLTISDQGVLPNQGLQVAKEEAPASLNSSPALGQMLSVEETRALREAFAPAAGFIPYAGKLPGLRKERGRGEH